MKTMNSILIIHNVRSAHNVGALFRTAEAGGIKKIYLSGYTPTPYDDFGRERGGLKKTALGAEKMIEWEHIVRIHTLISRLKKDGFFIVGIEQSRNAVDYKKIKSKSKIAFICGN